MTLPINLPVSIISYVILAVIVTLVSIKLADYVDLIDKKTNISGAFIGGVVLAAVTSLPELFTSISAVVIVRQPDLVIGNILGSNIFNETVLGVVLLICAKGFSSATVGKSHLKTTGFTIFIFLLMIISAVLGIDYTLFHISVFSVVIIITYALSIKFMASDDSENDEETDSLLTVKQITVRFIILAVVLVGASIMLTLVTDSLQNNLSNAGINLGKTVAGALFLGIATSLPELTSSLALVRKKNFNATTGNLLGSGVFNFCILAIADILYSGGSVYGSDNALGDRVGISKIFSRIGELDSTGILALFGTLATLFVGAALIIHRRASANKSKPVFTYRVLGFLIIACYLLFIVLSSV